MQKEQNLQRINTITEKIIGCSIEVHKILGPGLLESIYENALCVEFDTCGLFYEKQIVLPVIYKKKEIGIHRLDILVEEEVVLELKAVDRMDPVFEAQLLSYLKISGKKLRLLINFNVPILRNGIRRIIL